MTQTRRSPALGSMAWARLGGGTITADDEAELAAQIPYVLAERDRTATALPDLDLAQLEPPDSRLARDAETLWRDVAPDWLDRHGSRTWYFAAALARVEQLEPDPELLYVACVLHDLGLTDRFAPTREVPCFAVSGAHAARDVVIRHRPEPDAERVADAIAMHLNLRIDAEAGPLARLVAAGTLVDVTGLRLQLLPPSLVRAVLARHPRGDFGPAVGDALTARPAAFPTTRCGWLSRTLNVGALARQHPLDA